MALSQQQLLATLLQPPPQQQPDPPQETGKSKIAVPSAPLFKAPRARLAEAMQKIDKTFDAALCSDLDPSSLALLGWCFHRIKPSLSPTDLRVVYWEDLFDTMLTATERVKAID